MDNNLKTTVSFSSQSDNGYIQEKMIVENIIGEHLCIKILSFPMNPNEDLKSIALYLSEDMAMDLIAALNKILL
jgi:hypothetical protein